MINYILKNARIFFNLALFLPLVLNFIFFIIYENKIIFLIILNFFFYLSILFLYNLGKKLKENNRPRSPFKFIRNFNSTGNKSYSHKFRMKISEGGVWTRPLVGVEVGVFKGEHALKILNYLYISKLSLVDPWDDHIDYRTGELSFNKEEGDKMYLQVSKTFSKFKNVEVIRMTSLEASKKFENESLDFVYLDGDHSYEQVKIDLNSWYPKLKEYGVMCGDDYGHISGYGVIKAVNEFSFDKKAVVIFGEDRQFFFIKTNK